ncbi:MAG: CDP-alcohol phosphatidyltransferase family protein [Bacteroidota bacterium]
MLGPYKPWTISNFMSISRVLLLIPIVVFLLDDSPAGRYWAILFMAIAALTDFFDGYVARRLNQVTELGKVIDPLADKIVVGVIVVILVGLGKLPFWFAVAVVIRDMLIFLGGLYIARRKGKILESNQPGKWAALVIVVTGVFATLGARRFELLLDVLIGLSMLMLLISFGLYVKRFVEVLRVKSSGVNERWDSLTN